MGVSTLRRGQSQAFRSPHRSTGNTDEALRHIDEATEASATNGNIFFLAEIERLRGEIMRSIGKFDVAETCFNRSLDVARSQQARSWELRTTISLCRLWKTQNRCGEALRALGTIYDWFGEGFQTPDLIDAKQLLDTLG
jgi:predicted ATPase